MPLPSGLLQTKWVVVPLGLPLLVLWPGILGVAQLLDLCQLLWGKHPRGRAFESEVKPHMSPNFTNNYSGFAMVTVLTVTRFQNCNRFQNPNHGYNWANLNPKKLPILA